MPSVWAPEVAVNWPERTWKITSARCLALAFIYPICAGVVAGLASLLICSNKCQSSLLTQMVFHFFSRNKFETYVQVPICNRRAIQLNVIVVSARN
jgi:hypothetical protein